MLVCHSKIKFIDNILSYVNRSRSRRLVFPWVTFACGLDIIFILNGKLGEAFQDLGFLVNNPIKIDFSEEYLL